MSPRPGWTRRDVVRTLVAAGAAPVLPRVGWAGPLRAGAGGRVVSRLDPTIVIDGTDVRALAMRALEAAKAAGAQYADVRLTRRLRQVLMPDSVFRPLRPGSSAYMRLDGEHEQLAVGVRVRVGHAWGFAASPYWDAEDVVTLARDAARQAKANATGSAPAGEWAPVPVATGHWAMPVQADPFVMPVETKMDLLGAWMDASRAYGRPGLAGGARADFTREERAVATSDGSYFTQTLYSSEGEFNVGRIAPVDKGLAFGVSQARGLERTAAGWELFTEADIPGQFPRLWEEAEPLRPKVENSTRKWDVGRYNVVFSARAMVRLLDKTLGPATQLDRALGYEANAGGTSYLGPDPLALLGSYQAASPLVTVTANRSLPRGMATVKWDDEGVVPGDGPLVKDGVLVDYQTTRAGAALLAPYYQQAGRPVRSLGCAGAESALGITLQQMPNLVLAPAKAEASFEELIAGIEKGVAILDADIETDFQERTGMGHPKNVTDAVTVLAGGNRTTFREIYEGKLRYSIDSIAFSFNTTKLWKSIIALGGPASAAQYAARAVKGQPAQMTDYSVQAVPAVFKDVDFIDPTRRG